MSQSQGIQKLLQAEMRAKETVDEARRKRAKRLKEAKEEAQSDIESFKKEQDLKFKEKEAAVLGSRSQLALDIDKETQTKVAEQYAMLKQNQNDAIRLLLDKVQDVRPHVHVNYKKEAH